MIPPAPVPEAVALRRAHRLGPRAVRVRGEPGIRIIHSGMAPPRFEMEESRTLAQWKRFIEGLPPGSPVRDVILESWERCLQAGMRPDPEKPTFRRVPDEELQRRLQSDQELIEIARPHLEWTTTLLAPIVHVAYLVDRDGIVLFATGNAPQLMQDFGLLPGYDWSERTMGTNGAGTALVTGKPVAVIGPEHFSRPFHDCTCTGAPIREPSGAVIGAIDISTSAADATPERLKIAAHLAFVIEQGIAHTQRNKELVGELIDRNTTLEALNQRFQLDLTDRKQAEEAMRESEERFSLIMEHANDAIFYLDLHGGIQWVSSKAEFLTGYSAKDLAGRSFLELLTPETAKQGEVRLAAVRRGEPVPPLVEFEFNRPNGMTLWVEANITSVTSRRERGRVVGRLVVAREIMERKSAEEENRRLYEKVRRSQVRLRALSRRLIEVQENERRSLARELHDQTGQSLTSLLLGLQSLRKMPTLKEAQGRASELRKVTIEALEGVKRLAKGLRPGVLDDLGLEAALRRLTEEFSQASGLQVDLHVNGLDRGHLSSEVELAVYRIAQEALTNVAKHARAKTVSVIINASTSDLSLIIEDNGRGFDVNATSLTDEGLTHLGLHGMQERAALLNGDVKIESEPGQGTSVYAKIPLGARAEA